MELVRLRFPKAKTTRSRLPFTLSKPPVMPVLPVKASRPPLSRVSVCARLVVIPPALLRVSELMVSGTVTVPALLRETLARERRLVLISLAERARNTPVPEMVVPVVESVVANEVPLPEVLVSTKAHGMMALLVVPVPPDWPRNVNPVVEEAPVTSADPPVPVTE